MVRLLIRALESVLSLPCRQAGLSTAFAGGMEAPAGRQDAGEKFQCPTDAPRFDRLRAWGYSHFVALIILSTASSCDPQFEDGILYVFVEIDLNLSQSDYLDLRRDGGFVYILGGVRGIIVYRQNQDSYWAFERNSPVNPNEACAVVDVDESGLFIVDPCSGATFDFEGNPTNGISRFPLRTYTTTLDNNWLYIRGG